MSTAFDKWSKEDKETNLAKMIEIASNGGHQSAMCIALGLKSEDTFYRWKRELPEFKAMCDEAELHSKAYYEAEAKKQATGESKGNATSLAIIMNNKFRSEYKPETATTTNTTINVLNLSSAELDYKIAQKLEILKSFGVAPLLEHDD